MADPTTFAYLMLKRVQERITLTQEAIIHGTAKEYAIYRELVGELRGLEYAEQEIKDALSSSEEE